MPRVVHPTGLEEWRDEEGRLHREDGPAIVLGSLALYYCNGKPLTLAEHRLLRAGETFRTRPNVRGRMSALAG